MHALAVIQLSRSIRKPRPLFLGANSFRKQFLKGMNGLALLSILSVLFNPCLLNAESLVISEIMVQQGVNAVVDEDLDASDWIEIYNSSDDPADLEGWSLSDEIEQPRKWVFPNIVLEPRAFLIVFASGKDCRDLDQVLHTNFRLSSKGEFLGLFSPEGDLAGGFHPEYPKLSEGISYGFELHAEFASEEKPVFKYIVPENSDQDQVWTDFDFDDEDWDEGFGGIGFDGNTGQILTPFIDTDVSTKMRTNNSSVYCRYTIDVQEPNSLLQLLIRYDDGFVLYLNGEELMRRNAPTRLAWSARSTVTRIDGEELVPEQFTISSEDGLNLGANVLAVHGLNTRSTDRDFLFRVETSIWHGLGDIEGTPGYALRASPAAPNARVFSKALAKPAIISDE